MRTSSESLAEGTGKSQESFLVTGQSLVQRGLGGRAGRGHLWSAGCPSSLSPHRVLASGHQPSSVLRSPALGALGGEFLSSLPLPEYPPAFPLGADIQGRMHHQVGPSLFHPPWNQVRALLLVRASWVSAKGHNPGNSFFFAVKGSDRKLILIFFFPGLDLFSFLQTESQVSDPSSVQISGPCSFLSGHQWAPCLSLSLWPTSAS